MDSLRVREVVGKEEMVEKEEMEVMMKKDEVEEEEEEKELSKEHDCKKSICSLCKVGTRTVSTLTVQLNIFSLFSKHFA